MDEMIQRLANLEESLLKLGAKESAEAVVAGAGMIQTFAARLAQAMKREEDLKAKLGELNGQVRQLSEDGEEMRQQVKAISETIDQMEQHPDVRKKRREEIIAQMDALKTQWDKYVEPEHKADANPQKAEEKSPDGDTEIEDPPAGGEQTGE